MEKIIRISPVHEWSDISGLCYASPCCDTAFTFSVFLMYCKFAIHRVNYVILDICLNTLDPCCEPYVLTGAVAHDTSCWQFECRQKGEQAVEVAPAAAPAAVSLLTPNSMHSIDCSVSLGSGRRRCRQPRDIGPFATASDVKLRRCEPSCQKMFWARVKRFFYRFCDSQSFARCQREYQINCRERFCLSFCCCGAVEHLAHNVEALETRSGRPRD